MEDRSEKYEDAFVELGSQLISDCCDITSEEFFDFVYYGGNLPEDKVRRLDMLAEIVFCLEGAYRRLDGSIKKWFFRPRAQLGGLSPLDALSVSIPGVSEKVLALAKSLHDGNAT